MPASGATPDLALVACFFVYGLALFSLGFAVALELRHTGDAGLAASLRCLAAFGFLQAGREWLDARFALGGFAATAPSDPVRILGVLLLAGSGACLLLFGVRLLASLHPAYRWLRDVPWLLFAVWVGILILPHVSPVAGVGAGGGALCLECHPGQSSAFIAASGDWLTRADVWARYLLYFPGSTLAALAFLAQRPGFDEGGLPQLARYALGATAAFATNALVVGLVVTPAPWAPASLLNYATFSAALGLPPQVVGALAAVAVAYCVVRILDVFELDRQQQLARAGEERFQAQQEALETQQRARAEMAEWNRQLEARVQERTHQLEALHAQLKDLAVLEERDRIARELHDSLAQVLGYVGLRSSLAADLLAAGKADGARAELLHIEQVADEAYADVREAILGLRTKTQAQHDLVATLEEYLRAYSVQTGIHAGLELAAGARRALAPSVEIQLVRVIQEALTNIRKHAGAERVRVRLWEERGQAMVAVEDDGRGFDPAAPAPSGHFGLATMRERIELVGGQLRVESAPGRGARVIVSLPATAGEIEEPTGGKA